MFGLNGKVNFSVRELIAIRNVLCVDLEKFGLNGKAAFGRDILYLVVETATK